MADPVKLLADARADLAVLPAVLPRLLAGIDAARARREPAPGKWPPVVIVCHLRDEEDGDFGTRLRVALDGGSAFPPADPAAWVTERRYLEQPLDRALADFLAGRARTLAWLAGIDPEHLRRAVVHPKAGPVSGADLLASWAVHDFLHLRQLAATLAQDRAVNDWPDLRCDYAGDLPYPRG